MEFLGERGPAEETLGFLRIVSGYSRVATGAGSSLQGSYFLAAGEVADFAGNVPNVPARFLIVRGIKSVPITRGRFIFFGILRGAGDV